MNKREALVKLNECFVNSSSYNEAIHLFFDSFICKWLDIDSSKLPTDPQIKRLVNEDGSNRVLPLNNLIHEAQLSHFKI